MRKTDNNPISGRFFARLKGWFAAMALGLTAVIASADTTNDGSFSIQFASASYSVTEGGTNRPGTNALIRVTRSGALTGISTVHYYTSAGSAAEGVRYTDVSGMIVFPPSSNTATFTVPIINDNIVNGNQTVTLNLSKPSTGGLLGTPSVAVLTIIDDDGGTNSTGSGAVNLVRKAGTFAFVTNLFGTTYSSFNGTSNSVVNGVTNTYSYSLSIDTNSTMSVSTYIGQGQFTTRNGANVLLTNRQALFVAADYDGSTTGQSASTDDSYEGARVVVNRLGGSSGRVYVDYYITNVYYTVEMHTNVVFAIFVTNGTSNVVTSATNAGDTNLTYTTNSETIQITNRVLGVKVAANMPFMFPISKSRGNNGAYLGYMPQWWVTTYYSNINQSLIGNLTNNADIAAIIYNTSELSLYSQSNYVFTSETSPLSSRPGGGGGGGGGGGSSDGMGGTNSQTSVGWTYGVTNNVKATNYYLYYYVTIDGYLYDNHEQVSDAAELATYLATFKQEYPTGIFYGTTNVFTNTVVSGVVKVPAAVPEYYYAADGTEYVTSEYDYIPDSGTLVFDDYQMSQEILVSEVTYSSGGTVQGNLLDSMLTDWAEGLFPHFSGQNAVFEVVLSNPRFAPLESQDPTGNTMVTDIQPPVLDPYNNVAMVSLLDTSTHQGAGIPPYDRATNFDDNISFDGPDWSHETSQDNPTWPVINFERGTYRCFNSIGSVTLWLTRNGSSKDAVSVPWHMDFSKADGDWNSFPVEPGSEYAIPGIDFVTTNGTVEWGANDTRDKNLSVTILNTNGVQFERDFVVQLSGGSGYYLGNASGVNVTISFDDVYQGPKTAGSVDVLFNPDDDARFSYPPANTIPGANRPVYAVIIQSDGKAVLGGAFTAYDTEPYKGVVRVKTTGFPSAGFPDTNSFNVGSGANDSVTSIASDLENRIIIGGNFTAFNGLAAPRIGRLSTLGGLDTSFNPGYGPNGQIWAMAVQSDDKIIIGGDFTTYNATNRGHIARLNNDGTLDSSFNPGSGADGTIYAVATGSDGYVYIGGAFKTVNGVGLSSIARLDTNGVLDSTFNVGAGGIDSDIRALAVQADGKVVIGGNFTMVNLTSRNRIARLKTTGELDEDFDVGAGADSTVYCLGIQPDGKVIAGGNFRVMSSIRRVGLVRFLTNGWVDTSFMDTAYNQFAGIPTHYANPDAYDPSDAPAYNNSRQAIYALAIDSNTNIIIGGSFQRVGGGWARDEVRYRGNVARIVGGSTWGPGNITFMNSQYSVGKNSGTAFISITRTNGSLAPAWATFGTNYFAQGPGSASPTNFDIYTNSIYGTQPTWPSFYDVLISPINQDDYGNPTPHLQYDWHYSDAYWGPNYEGEPLDETISDAEVFLTINYDTAITGDKLAQLTLDASTCADQFFLGGQHLSTLPANGISKAKLKIIDNNYNAGTLMFGSPRYSVLENGGSVTLDVWRINGKTGNVNVYYSTANGSAVNGADFTATPGSLSFEDGITNKSITITINNNNIMQPMRQFSVILTNAGNGAALDPSNRVAAVTIVDDDFLAGYVGFEPVYDPASAGFFFGTSETAGYARVKVVRMGGSANSLSIQCAASDGSAVNNINYSGVTNTLYWDAGDASDKYLVIPVIHDHVVSSNLTVNLRLFNPILANDPGNTNNAAVTNYATKDSFFFPTSTLVITNVDSAGYLEFSADTYPVMENSGGAMIAVKRIGGSIGTVSVSVKTTDDSAINGVNYYGISDMRLVFGDGELVKTFTVTNIDDTQANPDRDYYVQLYNPSQAGLLTGRTNLTTFAKVVIMDNETHNTPAGSADPTFDIGEGFDSYVSSVDVQPDGKILVVGDFKYANGIPRNGVARLSADGAIDLEFQQKMDGANSTVYSVVSMTPISDELNGPVLLAGSFTAVNGVNRSRIARLYIDGSVDETFDPGSGADNTIYAASEVLDYNDDGSFKSRKAYIAGSFTHYNSVSRNAIARVNDDGTLDASFDTGSGAGVTNATIFALAQQETDDSILAGGDFTQFNGKQHARLVRLNSDGTLDDSFNPSIDGSVRSIVVQADGKIVIGGVFTHVNTVAMSHIARLNIDGSLDTGFATGGGADDVVLAAKLNSSMKILLGGEFLKAGGVTRHRFTRVLASGAADPAINFGNGADGFVSTIYVLDDGNMLIGGGFSSFNGVSSPGLARVFGGELDGSGALQFDAPLYSVFENGSNVVVSVLRTGGTSGTISAQLSTSDGPAIDGIRAAYANVDYWALATNIVFQPGETFQSVNIGVIDNFKLDGDRAFNLTLSTNYWGSTQLGGQPTARVRIYDDEASVSFAQTTDRVLESVPSGIAPVTLVRGGNTNSRVSVVVYTSTNGSAEAGVRYTAVTNRITFSPGQTNVTTSIPIINDTVVEGDQTVVLGLTNLYGAILVEPSSETLTIVEDDTAPGNVMFTTNTVYFSEGAGYALVNVIRTNGVTGVISVDYATTDGTAVSGNRYQATNGTLQFADGEISKTIRVSLVDNTTVDGNQYFYVQLSNPQGGAKIKGAGSISVVVQDNDSGFGFSAASYLVFEDAGSVTLQIFRSGASNSTLNVDCATSDNTAFANTNYMSFSNTLSFGPGEMLKSITIPILRDYVVSGSLSFWVALSNPRDPAGKVSVQVTQPSRVGVSIDDADCGFKFTTNSYTVVEGGTRPLGVNGLVGTNAVITVTRIGSMNGSNTVAYSVEQRQGGAATDATNGIRYLGTNGTLVFLPQVTSNNIYIPIINDSIVEGDQFVDISLFEPTGGAQIISNGDWASLDIIDDDINVSFSSPTYQVSECAGKATLTVVRRGLTNTPVTVYFSTADGSGLDGVNYTETSGTLAFDAGVLTNTFDLQVIPDSLVDGDKTVQLSLSAPGGGATLYYPSTATLTMKECEGTKVVPAGMALIQEGNGTTNGLVDTNETVTMRFGLRSVSGSTTNLVASLLASNGVFSMTAGTNTYGALTEDGHAVSKDFTFTVKGTNGQMVTALLQLKDVMSGNKVNTNFDLIQFTFMIGQTARSFTNKNQITINDNSVASPYASVINIDGLTGTASKITATLVGVTHSYAADINVLLSGPSGSNCLLMSHCGSLYGITNLRLGFDDAATTYLSSSAKLATGTNKPSVYNAIYQFSGAAPFSRPFPTNLSVFSNTVVNGPWSLWVQDDNPLNSGAISNGWILNVYSGMNIQASADLQLTMTAPATGVVGNSLTVHNTLTNYGPGSVSGVVWTNTIPAGWICLTTNLSGLTNQNGVLTYVVSGTLTNGSGLAFDVVLTPTTAGLMTNAAIVGGFASDANPDNNSAQSVINVSRPTADLAVVSVVSSPNQTQTNKLVTYIGVVTNYGPSPVTGVIVTNIFPDGITNIAPNAFGFSSDNTNMVLFATGVLTNDGLNSAYAIAKFTNASAVLPVGGSITLSFTNIMVGSNREVTDFMYVGSDLVDPARTNNRASAKTLIRPLRANIGFLSFTAPSQASPGDWVTVTAIVANQGPEQAQNIVLSYSNPNIAATNLTNVTMAVGGSWTNLFRAQIRSAGGQFTNSGLLTADSEDPALADNSALSVISVANSPTVSVASKNGQLTFSWPLTNGAFALETTPAIGPDSVWTVVTNQPVVTGAQTILPVDMPTNSPESFYRIILK